MICLVDLLDGFEKIGFDGTANAPAGKFQNINILSRKQGAVDADLTDLIDNYGHFLLRIEIRLQQMLNQGGFPGTQKTGYKKYFHHFVSFMYRSQTLMTEKIKVI
jgi:hypothetical protein